MICCSQVFLVQPSLTSGCNFYFDWRNPDVRPFYLNVNSVNVLNHLCFGCFPLEVNCGFLSFSTFITSILTSLSREGLIFTPLLNLNSFSGKMCQIIHKKSKGQKRGNRSWLLCFVALFFGQMVLQPSGTFIIWHEALLGFDPQDSDSVI